MPADSIWMRPRIGSSREVAVREWCRSWYRRQIRPVGAADGDEEWPWSSHEVPGREWCRSQCARQRRPDGAKYCSRMMLKFMHATNTPKRRCRRHLNAAAMHLWGSWSKMGQKSIRATKTARWRCTGGIFTRPRSSCEVASREYQLCLVIHIFVVWYQETITK